jgi:hypothetical protein
MLVTVAYMGVPVSYHWEVPKGTKDGVPSNDFPNKWGRVLEVVSSRGTPFYNGLPVHIENMSPSLDSAQGEPL